MNNLVAVRNSLVAVNPDAAARHRHLSQVTDLYLLGLAACHSGTLVSFDLTLAWQAVRGSSSKLITHPGQG